MTETTETQEQKREKFNRIMKTLDLVLMNNIPEVDPSVLDNFEGNSPYGGECEIEPTRNNRKTVQANWCFTHNIGTDDDYHCDDYSENEVYQWFACNQSDAEFLARHNQYVTYSDLLDTYFLTICHFGTSWDYVDSMVNDITEGM